MSSRSDPLHGSETAGRFSPVSPHSLPGGCPQPPPRHAPRLKKWPLAGSPGLLRSPHRESRLVNGFQILFLVGVLVGVLGQFSWVAGASFLLCMQSEVPSLTSTAFSVQPVLFSISFSFGVQAKREGSRSHQRNVHGKVCRPMRISPIRSSSGSASAPWTIYMQ